MTRTAQGETGGGAVLGIETKHHHPYRNGPAHAPATTSSLGLAKDTHHSTRKISIAQQTNIYARSLSLSLC
jgi:hypothetical protein